MNNKLVAITGASAGIGLACAEIFAKNGYDLALGARRASKLDDLKKRILSNNPKRKVWISELDVCKIDSVTSFKEKCIKEAGHPSIIINNAGLAAGVDHLSEAKEEDWQKMLDTNVSGLLRFTRAFLSGMITNKQGQIINIGSISGHFSYAGGGVYCGTKHAVKAISQALRIELLGKNIRVNMVSPGMVDTSFSEVRLQDKTKADAVYKGFEPLHAVDIAKCALFIAQSPAHVNIDDLIVMPTDQASVFHVHRT